MQTKNLKYHQNIKHLKASELKEIKNKNKNFLSKSKLISDDLFKALSESLYLEKISYDQWVERILSEIQSHFKYVDYSESS